MMRRFGEYFVALPTILLLNLRDTILYSRDALILHEIYNVLFFEEKMKQFCTWIWHSDGSPRMRQIA